MASFDGRHSRVARGLGVVLGLLLTGLVLRRAGATRGQVSAALADPQGYVTAAGADAFVLALATAICWLLLCWVAVGAVLVLGAAAPGWIGWIFTALARLLLPATLRRLVSLGLGVALLTGTSVASAAPPATMAAISVSVDWPQRSSTSSTSSAAVPDWPVAAPGAPAPVAEPAAAGSTGMTNYVVQPGDCLWDIVERALIQVGRPNDAASIAAGVAAWWQVNRSQIVDPDLIYPGQVLQAPAP